MKARAHTLLRARWPGYLAALASVALVTLLIGLLQRRVHIANISMLYLLAVFATALAFGGRPAILASVAAFLTFNFFFTVPFHTFTVTDPAEWLALVHFLVTAAITSQLAARVRQRAQEAEQREHEAVVLYDVVWSMGEPVLHAALRAVAERLREELRLEAVAIELADSPGRTGRASAGEAEALRLVHSRARSPAQLLSKGATPGRGRRSAAGRWIRIVDPRPGAAGRAATRERLHVVPVQARGQQVGELRLLRHAGATAFAAVENRLLLTVAGQLGLAVERERLRREATGAEVLRRTDQLKTALLSAVSHDLRTPLASIIAAAGSLLQEDVRWTTDERREFAEAIRDEAQRLNRIVGNLLDLSRIEAGTLRPEKSWHDLGALVDDVLGRLRPLTARHQVCVDVPEDLPPVPLDYLEIDQVLSNLVENATKYAPPGTEIRICACSEDGQVQVEVADRGAGVPAAALAHLFEPFYRVEGQGVRPKGTGLGLAVVRGLVEAHGGRIWAENRKDGGARFRFTLPLDLPQAASRHLSEASSQQPATASLSTEH